LRLCASHSFFNFLDPKFRRKFQIYLVRFLPFKFSTGRFSTNFIAPRRQGRKGTHFVISTAGRNLS